MARFKMACLFTIELFYILEELSKFVDISYCVHLNVVLAANVDLAQGQAPKTY